MSHFIGKVVFNKLIGMRIADVEYDEEIKKCIVIPIKENGIQQWKDEWQLWFRAFCYKKPKGTFTHFLMKFIRLEDVKKLSQSQIEAFSNHQIGGMMKSSYDREMKDRTESQNYSETDDTEILI